MKNTWKLSNYLFDWVWKRGAGILTIGSAALGVLVLLFKAFPLGNTTGVYYAEAFLPYEAVIDRSLIPIFFSIGIIGLWAALLVQYRALNKTGKYTMFTLPMKQSSTAISFILAALALFVLYYLIWMVLLFAAYFPITAIYEKQAAKEVFYISAGNTLTGLDAHRTNGLFLAFRRGEFLSAAFPTTLHEMLSVLAGLAWSVGAVIWLGLFPLKKAVSVLIGVAVVFSILTAGFSFAFAVSGAWDTESLTLGGQYLMTAEAWAASAVLYVLLFLQMKRKGIDR